MPSQVRIIAGPRNTSFDHFIEDILKRGAWETEHTYFGIEDQDRARHVRSKLQTAGRHMDPVVAVKSFYYECTGCPDGGPSCRYHVSFTAYDMEKAKTFVEKRNQLAAQAVNDPSPSAGAR